MGTRPSRIFEMSGCLNVAVWAAGLSLVVVLISAGAFVFGAVGSGVDQALHGTDPSAARAVAVDHVWFGMLAVLFAILSSLAAGTVVLFRTLTGVGR